jgi:DnaK suppressor protein
LSGLNDSKNDYTDFVDQAANETDTDYVLHIREREGNLVTKIKEALQRLEQGTYGICEECGEEISEARLEARPVARLCIACKKREEAAERLRGR